MIFFARVEKRKDRLPRSKRFCEGAITAAYSLHDSFLYWSNRIVIELSDYGNYILNKCEQKMYIYIHIISFFCDRLYGLY